MKVRVSFIGNPWRVPSPFPIDELQRSENVGGMLCNPWLSRNHWEWDRKMLSCYLLILFKYEYSEHGLLTLVTWKIRNKIHKDETCWLQVRQRCLISSPTFPRCDPIPDMRMWIHRREPSSSPTSASSRPPRTEWWQVTAFTPHRP